MNIANFVAAAILAGITLTTIIILLKDMLPDTKNKKHVKKVLRDHADYEIVAIGRNDFHYRRKGLIGKPVSINQKHHWRGPWFSGSLKIYHEASTEVRIFHKVLLKKLENK